MPRVSGMLLLLGLATPGFAQPLVLQVAARRRVYRVGRPVSFTLQETNVTEHAVQVAGGCRFFGAFVSHDGAVVRVYRSIFMCATRRVPLRAGATRRVHMRWDGRATEPGQEVGPGRYVITTTVDGLLASTTVRLRDD